MDIIQEQVIDLLNASIHNEKPKLDYSKDVQWDDIFEEADSHSIRGLLYPTIKRIDNLDIDENILKKLKKITFLTAIRQSNHIKQTAYLINLFNENNIPIIVLKGLVIRDLYPQSDLRTMCDSDILIHIEDMEKVRNILLDLGYIEEEDAGHHIAFRHEQHLSVEIHWTLANEKFRKGQECFQANIWDDAMGVEVGGVSTLSLSLEDLALHLCAHMASHMAITGFGVRQLCDLVLLVEQKGDLINWNNFMTKASVSGLEKFSVGIFITCNYLFNMKVPNEILRKSYNNERENIELLVEDIFAGGVYGQRDLSYKFRAMVAYDKEIDGTIGFIKRYAQIIFPPASKLTDKYSYAKKYNVLLPIAWVHHGFVGLFSKEYDRNSKIKFLTSTISNAQKRNKIVEWLEL